MVTLALFRQRVEVGLLVRACWDSVERRSISTNDMYEVVIVETS